MFLPHRAEQARRFYGRANSGMFAPLRRSSPLVYSWPLTVQRVRSSHHAIAAQLLTTTAEATFTFTGGSGFPAGRESGGQGRQGVPRREFLASADLGNRPGV